MEPELILDEWQVTHKTKRIAYEIWEHNQKEDALVIAGIYDRGYALLRYCASRYELYRPCSPS